MQYCTSNLTVLYFLLSFLLFGTLQSVSSASYYYASLNATKVRDIVAELVRKGSVNSPTLTNKHAKSAEKHPLGEELSDNSSVQSMQLQQDSPLSKSLINREMLKISLKNLSKLKSKCFFNPVTC
uniref:Uncharacterized protein n=1 Tax=Ascaris lumbricoides TaxID=6252 RepID=A0A0M3HWU2_ASCLU